MSVPEKLRLLENGLRPECITVIVAVIELRHPDCDMEVVTFRKSYQRHGNCDHKRMVPS